MVIGGFDHCLVVKEVYIYIYIYICVRIYTHTRIRQIQLVKNSHYTEEESLTIKQKNTAYWSEK